ncbi:MAG: thrombospondin type 3 repeat-containing protein [Kiritimatiellae bacterium]|nr:thrombospondin type 3 repeat-containing protein [Kiritimatiellia bacterium]
MKRKNRPRCLFRVGVLALFLGLNVLSYASTNVYLATTETFEVRCPLEFECSRFGHDVTGVGPNAIVISAPGADLSGLTNGCVFIFNVHQDPLRLELALGIENPATSSISPKFGFSVAPFDDHAFLVGAPGVDGPSDANHGEAYLYGTNGSLITVFFNPVVNPGEQHFGSAVSAVGSGLVAIGAPGADGGRGRVYLMTTNAAVMATITNPIAIPNMGFGHSLARVGSSRFVVGSKCGERVFIYNTNGSLRDEALNPAATDALFGQAVGAFGDDHFIVGSRGFNAQAAGNGGDGRAYIINTNGAVVRVIKNPRGFSPGDPHEFGFDVVAYDDAFSLISAPYSDESSVSLGAVYVQDANNLLISTITNPASPGSPEFGWSLASVRSNMFVVGSPSGLVDTFDGFEDWGLAHFYRTELSLPDPFEPDDNRRQARAFLIGDTELHNFHEPGDQDWVKFFMHSNYVYDITVEALGLLALPDARLLRQKSDGTLSDVTAVFPPNNKTALGEGPPLVPQTTVTISNALTGFYFLNVSSVVSNLAGSATSYSLGVSAKSGNTTALIVIAVDLLSPNGENSPPGSEVVLTGITNFSMGSGNAISITDISPGDYLVEVTYPPGYAPDEDPELAGQPQNTNSILFGNPKHVSLIADEFNFAIFVFLPVITAQGVVRDAETGAWVDEALLGFQALTTAVSGVVFTQFPNTAVWSDPWQTDVSGQFPDDVIMPRDDFDLFVTRDGYNALHLTNFIIGSSAALTNDLGEIMLAPIDANTNDIADAWELLHFGGATVATNDADGDGYSNLDEYRLGTDPTNAASALTFELPSPPDADPFVVRWPVANGREYEVLYMTHLTSTSVTLGFGPWTAPSNGVGEWIDSGSSSSSGRFYSIRVNLP